MKLLAQKRPTEESEAPPFRGRFNRRACIVLVAILLVTSLINLFILGRAVIAHDLQRVDDLNSLFLASRVAQAKLALFGVMHETQLGIAEIVKGTTLVGGTDLSKVLPGELLRFRIFGPNGDQSFEYINAKTVGDRGINASDWNRIDEADRIPIKEIIASQSWDVFNRSIPKMEVITFATSLSSYVPSSAISFAVAVVDIYPEGLLRTIVDENDISNTFLLKRDGRVLLHPIEGLSHKFSRTPILPNIEEAINSLKNPPRHTSVVAFQGETVRMYYKDLQLHGKGVYAALAIKSRDSDVGIREIFGDLLVALSASFGIGSILSLLLVKLFKV